MRELLNNMERDGGGRNRGARITSKPAKKAPALTKTQKAAKNSAASEKTVKKTPKAGYYTPRQYGGQTAQYQQKAEAARAEMELRAKVLQRNQKFLQTSRANLERKKKRYYDLSEILSGDGAAELLSGIERDWTDAVSVYGKAKTDFDAAWITYSPAEEAYNKATEEYNQYIQQEQNAYDEWKSTIRSADEIRSEMKEIKNKKSELALRMSWANDLADGFAAPGIEAQAGTNELKIRELQQYLGGSGEREKLLQEELEYSEYFRYEDLRSEENFAQENRYQPERFQDKDKDALYNWVNTYGGKEYKGTPEPGDEIHRQLQYIKQNEIDMYNYLYATEGNAEARKYLTHLGPELDRRATGEMVTETKAWAGEHPVLASAVSTLTSPVAGLSSMGGMLTEQALGMGTNVNGSNNALTHFKNAIREEVGGQVEKNWGPLGSFGYQTGMSMADMVMDKLAALPTGGATAMAMIGSRAFSETVIDAKKRGLDDAEAMTLGAESMLAELLTERIGLDEMLKLPKGWDNKAFWKQLVKGAAGEAAEEGLTNIYNLAADLQIAGDKSEFMQDVQGYRDAGLDDEKAVLEALGDAGISLLADAAGGAISGGVFGGIDGWRGKRAANTQQKKKNAADNAAPEKPAGEPMGFADGENDTDNRTTTHGNGTQPVAGVDAQTGARDAQEKADAPQGKNRDGWSLEQLKQDAVNRRNPLISGVMQTAQDEETVRRIQKATTKTEVTALDRGLSQEDTEMLLRIREYTGREIIVEEFNDNFHAYYDRANDEIHVAADSENIMASSFGHELTHSIEKTTGWKKLLGLVQERTADQGQSWEKLRQEKIRFHAGKGQTLTADGADAEIVARYVEQHLLTDENAIRQLVRDDRSVARRILDWLDGIWAKVAKTKGAKEREFIRNARECYRDALAQAGEERRRQELQESMKGAYADGDDEAGDAAFDALYAEDGSLLEADWSDFDESEVQFSFAGENAKGADREALAQAKRMERNGDGMRKIFRETGWFRGADRKWRFEIDDSGMKYHKMGDAQFSKDHPEYVRFRELELKFIEGTITDAEIAEMAELRSTWANEAPRLRQMVARGNAKLRHVLAHDALFEQYPQLLDVRVRFGDTGDAGGYWDQERNEIVISNRYRHADPAFLELTLLHEIQHAIQDIEGFAGGANPEYWEQRQRGNDPIREHDTAIAKAEREAQAALKGVPPEVQKDFWYAANMLHNDPEGAEKLENELFDGEYADAYSDYSWAIWTLQDLLEQDNPKRTAKDLYRSTAGEIEARDAANRRGLDAGARKNRLPDMGDERTVFVEGNGRQYSIKETTDGRMVAIVDSDILSELGQQKWDRATVSAAREAAKTALSAFKKGISVNGTHIKVNRTTRREYTKSDYSDMLRRKDPVVFADKMRAASVMDDAVTVAVGWKRDGELKYPREDFVDFSRGRTLLVSGNNQYEAEVVVGITESGDLVLYDLVDIMPGDFTVKESEPSTTATTKKSIGDIQEGSDEVSITHEGGAVNQYSMKETDQEYTMRDIGALQQERYQLKEERNRMLMGNPNYAKAVEDRRYATTFKERAEASRAIRAAEAEVDTSEIDARMAEIDDLITDIRESEKRRHERDRELYSGTKTAGYATLPDTRIKELDSEYESAVKSGDRKRMAELVREAAEAAMPKSTVRGKDGKLLKVYHYTNAKFTAFDRGQARTGNEMDGFFFAPDPESSREYGNKRVVAYLNITNPAKDPYLDRLHDDSGTLLREKLAYQGYDGVIRTEADGSIYEYMAFDPEQIKSAEPVTYDDNGEVVPLSKRFDFKNPDIRFSLKGEENGFTEGWHDDDEAARAAQMEGYPVLNGVQVVPMKTWVRARDYKRNPDGSIFYDRQGNPVRYDNYGLVAGLGDKPGTLKINFHNKNVVNEETGQTIRRDNVQIAYEDLTPTPGVFSQTEEDFASLIGQAPEQPGAYNYSEEELAEIEELRSRASMEEDAAEERPVWTAVEPEKLSGKERDFYDRAKRKLAEQVARALDVPRQAKREFLEPIAQRIAEEYLQTGTVSQELRSQLFEEGWKQGIVADREFLDTYKEVKDYLRTTGITLSETDRDSRDWAEFRKRSFGTLRLVNEGGLPVDTAWGKLQEMAPALFPGDILNPEDMVKHMAEVAASIRKTEKSLDEFYGPDAALMKRASRNDFEVAVQTAMAELRQVKRVADERAGEAAAVTGEEGEELTAEAVMALYPKLKETRRAAEKAMAKNLLTKQDKQQVQRLLRGDIQPEHLDPKRDNVEGILAVYEAKKAFEEAAAPIRKWNRQQKAKLYAQAEEIVSNAGRIVDKKRGYLYSRETMERNFRDIFKNREAAERMVEVYAKPVHEGSANAIRMKNRYRERVKALGLSRKVAKGNTVSEAYAVQFYGEVSDILRMMEESKFRLKKRDGKTYLEWKAELQKLWEENPSLDKGKIEDAAREFGKIYEELFDQMNEVRVRNGYEPINHRRGYFPHFQQDGRDGIMGLFGKALGIDVEVQQLPTTINGLTHTFKPGIRWFGNALERKGFDTAYDAVEGFDRYIEGVADVVHHTDNIQRLRALANQIRYRTSDEGLREQIRKIQERTDLSDEEKDALIREKTKEGKFELSNFVVELDEYTNLLANKKSRADRNMEQAMGRDMYNIVKSLEGRVAANMVAINPGSWLTNFIPITQGWACLDTRMMLKGMRDTVMAVKNDDGIVDESDFLTGRQGSDPLVQTSAQGRLKDWTNRQTGIKKLGGRIVDGSIMEWIDGFTAGTLVRARLQQNLAQGMSRAEAMSEANEWTAGVMADRTKGAMPTVFHRSNPLTKLFTQFQLEVNNQLSYLFKDIPREKRDKAKKELALALLKFAIGAWLYNEAYEFFFGRRPALDVADMVFGFSGDLADPELDFADAAMGLGEKIAENTPFIGGLLGGGRVPISSALPNAENLLKAVGNKEWSAGKRLSTAAKELAKPAVYMLPPFGGGQIKKIWEGLKMIRQGGSYTVDKDGNPLLQYPLHSTDSDIQKALEAGQAMIFGKTTIRSGREWVEGGFGNLTADQTAAYQALISMDVEQADAFELLTALRSAEKDGDKSEAAVQRDILRASGLEGDALAVVYYDVMVTDNSREKAVIEDLQKTDADMGRVTNCLMDMKDAGNAAEKYSILRNSELSGDEVAGIYYGMILDEGSREQALMDTLRESNADMGAVTNCLLAMKTAANSNAKRDAIRTSGLTDAQKKEIYQLISEDRNDDIEAFRGAGMDMDDFLEVQNQYTTIKESYEDEGDMATAFARWVNGRSYTKAQKAVARERFKYWNMIPANADSYDKAMEAGLNDEDAFELTEALNELEPPEGKTSVQQIQKWRVGIDNAWGPENQLQQLKAVGMDEKVYAKCEALWNTGVAPAAYVRAQELKGQFDSDGNGSLTNKDWEKLIDSMVPTGIVLPGDNEHFSLTNEQMGFLWQMLTGNKSTKNNPFSRTGGEKWLAIKKQMKEDEEG